MIKEFKKDGFNLSGYNRHGFNREGIHIITRNHYDTRGYDTRGIDCSGYNQYGLAPICAECDADRIVWENEDGFDEYGYRLVRVREKGSDHKIEEFYIDAQNMDKNGVLIINEKGEFAPDTSRIVMKFRYTSGKWSNEK